MISRHRLLNIGWINNKVLLYSTGDYMHSFLIMGKNMEQNTCILSHFAAQQKLTQNCKSTVLQ